MDKRFMTITSGNFHAGDIATIRGVFSDILKNYEFLSVADVAEYVSVGSDYMADFFKPVYGWMSDDDFKISILGDGALLFDAPMPIRKPVSTESAYHPCTVPSDFVSIDEDEEDMVNHPPHYQSNTGLEVIDVIKAFVADPASYYVGNIIKYICRHRHKNGTEDVKKAGWYLNQLIEHLEKESNHHD